MDRTTDILIIGGGVIGLTTAYRLAEQGAAVTVVDRGQVGQEASWAGAGMLPPGNPATAATPEARLRAYSCSLWEQLTVALRDRTGVDNGYRQCGAVEVAASEDGFAEQIRQWQQEDLQVERLHRKELEQHVGGLNEDIESGVFLPEFAQVRNPRHLKALVAACHCLGVEIIEHIDGVSLQVDNEATVVVSTADRRFFAEQICITAGSWTRQLLNPLKVTVPVHPVRGQIVQLRLPCLPFRCVIEQERRYIVPRPDGLILVGATEEDTGFEKRTTADGIAELLMSAKHLVPELGHAEVVRSWAGLRPGSPDELPFLGRVSEFDNLFIGAGHFRSGLQMSPGTGWLLADLMLGREPQIAMDGLTLTRSATSPSPSPSQS
ncbi:MAG: glycine oxidase ThiO [Fuerstiella sp.]